MIVDSYGGPGGWAEGLKALGLSEVGIELDPWACATRRAAGHPVVRADVASFPVEHLAGRVEGIVMSPPCQAFSNAGDGEGRELLEHLVAAVHAGDWSASFPERVRHVLEAGRWVETIRPQWVALEQVPPVLPVWHAYADRWRTLGYSTWAGVLCAADYGVPQTRQRAILLAGFDRPALPPVPTHARTPGLLGERPWVSMDDALGWGYTDRPARTLCGNRTPRWLYQDADGTHGRVLDRRTNSKDGLGGMVPTVPVATNRPAPTLTSKCLGQWVVVEGDERQTLTTAEALTLQGFRPDYPVRGNRSEVGLQVANAVPPPLAAHVIAAVTGRRLAGGVPA